MKKEKQRIILDGNAFYEIDLECLKAKRNNKEENEKKEKEKQQEKQRD